MILKSILLKFAGPLQSWGTNSHFETRYTDYYPSKSALIGIIAASFGYRRFEDENIIKLNDIDFACRVDQKGTLLRDYHTAQKFKPNGNFDRTYVTDRYYLEDAVCIVAIGHENEEFVDKIQFALKNPYFQTFMGRRSLPLAADFFIGCVDSGVVKSLEDLPWQAGNWYKKRFKNTSHLKLDAYADAHLMEGGYSEYRRDRVISFSQKDRKFAFRSETRFTIEVENDEFVNINKEEHDAFGALGD